MAHDLLFALVWYLIFTVFGLSVLPLSMWVFRSLPDAGILLSRPLGWLLLGFSGWYLAYLKILPFSRFGLIVIFLLLFGFNIYLLSIRSAWTMRKLRLHWRTALNGEILTILAFLLILLARREDPSINNTEKPMDIMFLNALTVHSEVPPPDPWLAGEHINYHYGGYLLNAIPAKLSGIPPEIAYNLSIGMLAALAASCAFVLGRALFGRCRWGALSVLCTLLIGNLASAFEMIGRKGLLHDIWSWRFDYMWKTSRVIYDLMPTGREEETINEYPLFTTLWGDLHPHYNNLPFVLFFAALVLALLHALRGTVKRHFYVIHLPLLVVTTISCSMIFPTNLFDFPNSSLILGAAVLSFLLFAFSYRRQNPVSISSILLCALVVFIPSLAYLIAAPFWLNFESPLKGPLLKMNQYYTDFGEFMLVFGLHTVATAVYLWFRGLSLLQNQSKETIGFFGIIVGMLFVILWGYSGHIVFAMSPIVALTLWSLAFYFSWNSKNNENVPEIFALILCALAWSLIAGCEFIYLDDNYPSERLNTLFKFHFPAWLYMGIGLPFLIYHAARQLKNTSLKVAGLIPVGLALLLSCLAPVYIFSSLFLMSSENRPVGLNGLAFMQQERPHHYSIIQWVKDNTGPNDRILEIPGCGYRLDSLVSAFTGRPTLLGWMNHEGLWRANAPFLEDRRKDIVLFYSTPDWDKAKAILKKYDIKYVSFTQPDCDIYTKQMPQYLNGAFRQHLKPIIQEKGNRYNPNAIYELYRVPDSL